MELLKELLVEIRLLRADLASFRRPDHALEPGSLLAAIAECAPDTDFTTRELVRHARFAEPMKELLNGMPPKKIGRFFKRIEGQDFNGLRVERIGSDSAGVIWRVYGDEVPETH